MICHLFIGKKYGFVHWFLVLEFLVPCSAILAGREVKLNSFLKLSTGGGALREFSVPLGNFEMLPGNLSFFREITKSSGDSQSLPGNQKSLKEFLIPFRKSEKL